MKDEDAHDSTEGHSRRAVIRTALGVGGLQILSTVGSCRPSSAATPRSQPPREVWNRRFGGTNREIVFSTARARDGVVLAGGHGAFGSGPRAALLVKLDSDGNLEWRRTFDRVGAAEEYVVTAASSVVRTDDGGFAVCGWAEPLSSGRLVGWLSKLDSAGATEWSRIYSEGEAGGFVEAVVQADDGYALCGRTFSEATRSHDGWLLKTDATGDLEWSNTYGTSDFEQARSVVTTRDGGFALAGSSYATGGRPTGGFWLVKTRASGEQQWARTFEHGGTAPAGANDLVQTRDRGFVLCGSAAGPDSAASSAWLVRTDSAGVERWNRTYGDTGVNSAESIVRAGDGGYVFCGTTGSGRGFWDAWVVRTGANGTEVWKAAFGGAFLDRAYSISRAGHRQFVFAGFTQDFLVTDPDRLDYYSWAVKIEDDQRNESARR